MFGMGYSRDSVYLSNHAILKKYTPDCYKVVFMKNCRQPGFEEQGETKGKRNSAGHTSKLDASISRSRSKIFELAMCNPWDYFVTLTLSPENGNRRDLHSFKSSLSKWLNNLNFRYDLNIKYLLVPEPHENGCWHMHGLFMGIPADMLTPFSVHDHLPYRVLSMLREGRKIFNWPVYAEKYGYVTCERIRDREATAKYITKYITKELGKSMVGLNEKLYLCSHGLKRAETVYRGTLSREFEPDFCNEYVAVKSFHTLKQAMELFVDDEFCSPVSFLSLIDKYKGGSIWKPCLQT